MFTRNKKELKKIVGIGLSYAMLLGQTEAIEQTEVLDQAEKYAYQQLSEAETQVEATPNDPQALQNLKKCIKVLEGITRQKPETVQKLSTSLSNEKGGISPDADNTLSGQLAERDRYWFN